MKKICLIIPVLWVNLSGQFVPTISSSVTDDAASVILNPAGLGVSRQLSTLFLVPMDFTRLDSAQNDFSVYAQIGRTGLGYTYLAEGRDLFHWGSGEHVGKGIFLGSTSHFSREGYEAVDLGVMYRGFPWFSGGLRWKNLWARQRAGARSSQQLAVGIAFRPFGARLTMGYDQRFEFDAESFANWRNPVGLAQIHAEPLDGLKLFVSYDTRNRGIQVGLSVGFGEISVESYHDVDKRGGYGQSLMGFHTSEEVRHTMFRPRKATFIELTFDRPLNDSPTPRALFGPKTVTLKELRDTIRKMAEDRDVQGIILKPDRYEGGGLGMTEELVTELRKFRDSGKKIYAFMDMGGDVAYALASVADSVYLNSGGLLVVDGLAFGIGFLKGLFDKIGVEAQFYRRGDYKTAAEPYTREHLSEASRQAYRDVLADMHEVFSRTIREGRGWSQEKLLEVYGQALFTPSMAVETGLVDGIYHPDQIEEKIKQIAGREVRIIKAKERPKEWAYDWKGAAAPKIALIYAEGPILPGKSERSPFGGDKIIGSETTARAIREAREDKSIKAIVMRVNSPGGSVLASEDIWREVHRTTHPDSADRKNRKPFIVSMGDVAASGGYYISCAADTIVADSGTITGSVGVLAGKLSLEGLFQKIGYHVDVVKEQPHAEQFGTHRPFSEEEGRRMQAIVDSYYEQFLRRVSEGRGLTVAEVDSIAQGRIWSGVDAKEKGLVDVLGGLDRALELARETVGLEEGDYLLKIYKGVEERKLEIPLEAKSDLRRLLETFEDDIPVARILDRAKLIHDEPVLYLMDGEPLITD